jgi:hypothetical protein
LRHKLKNIKQSLYHYVYQGIYPVPIISGQNSFIHLSPFFMLRKVMTFVKMLMQYQGLILPAGRVK